MTLLEKAKSIPVSRTQQSISDDEIDLAIAWVKGEITFSQIAKALDYAGGNQPYAFVANSIRHAYAKGLIKISIPPNKK
jgi:hypothetical protein